MLQLVFVQSLLRNRLKNVWLLAGLVLFLSLTTPHAFVAYAGDATYVNWSTLGLSQDQESEIDRMESQWKKTYSDIYPQILKDKSELRRLLNSPNSDERQIMDLQTRIQSNEQRLRQEATRTFLNKKEKLSPTQKQRLQQMIGQ